MQLCQKPYHWHWCVSKSSFSGNFKKSTVCHINLKQMSRLKSGMQFFLTELHAQNYRFQLCAFLKFGKISEITSGVEILLNRSRRSKQFCGKIPGRSANVPKKDSTSDVSKSCWKVKKKIGGVYENSNIFYKVFYADVETFKWLFCSFTLMKSCHRFFMPMPRLSNGCSILFL